MSVAKRDYYEVLSVSRECDEQTLKSAYRKLALQYHPDRNPGDKQAEEKFKEAAEAYAVLSDSNKRAAYDRFGHQGVSGAGGNGFSDFDTSQFADLGDILGEMFGLGGMFGGGRGRNNNQNLAVIFLAMMVVSAVVYAVSESRDKRDSGVPTETVG